jgi:SAM-dependent methyltransferase
VDRLESVWLGRDAPLLDAMFAFYAPSAQRIIDVCCNERRMWNKAETAKRVVGYDIDPAMQPDVVAAWHSMPDADGTVDVLVYDPPHLPLAGASAKCMPRLVKDHGIGRSVKGDNIEALHADFLTEAARVLKPDGLIFAKIKDYVHNHKYQWNLAMFTDAVRAAGLTPCDVIIKIDPSGGRMISSKWINAHHAKNRHCFWAVVRKGGCESKVTAQQREVGK